MREGVDYEVSHDHNTTWVNAEQLLGRFGKFGVDVHRDGVCVSCHSKTGDGMKPLPMELAEWTQFQSLMKSVHGIEIGDEHMPGRLRG